MSKSGSLRLHDARTIIRLIGECRDLGDDATAWRDHWIAELARLTDAHLGHAGEMAGCRALRPRDLGVTVWGWQTGFTDANVVEAQLDAFRKAPDYSPALLDHLRRQAVDDGACHTRKDLIPDRPWYRSPDYDVVQTAFGVDHILWCFHTIPGAAADECSGVVLNRARGRRDFGARDRTLIREAHAALAPLIGGPLARFQDPSPLDLAPRVRQVLGCLLEGDGDKQIAARLALSPHTVNQYTKAIYHHFGVQSRPELLARWVRRGWGRRPWFE